MNVRYSSEFDVDLFGLRYILAVKKFFRLPPSGKDARLCSDPEEYYGVNWAEYDVLDENRNLANHIKNEISEGTEEEIQYLLCNGIYSPCFEPTYMRQGVIER